MSRLGWRGGRVLAATLLVSSAALLAGCGGAGTTAPAAAPPASSAAAASDAPASAKVRPVQVRIPRIDAQSSLIAVAVNPDGSMQVPSVDKPMQAAWYRLGPVPGDPGPAIILGHVDGNHQPGIFYRLHELKPGDEVFVTNSDGKQLRFVVDHRDQVPKEQFPNDAVYGNTPDPQLRLITCGGAFDGAVHSYKDNIIVYAKLA
ncbi:class F sortase [Gandjariella thermophila]|uniref:Class F sortase n=1 Tax=Gandjariella thermophila TaxID=1931992 RepID=A0A4D4JAN9_9PSEU|nr:class F sortase [Gandjariella thermophila]GDY32080.1 class F sortase [Gandjariella thermophila]